MKSIRHDCSACGHVDEIPWAVLAGCPTCLAPAGQLCVNLSAGKNRAPIAVAHHARLEITRQMDRARTGRSGLRIVEMTS